MRPCTLLENKIGLSRIASFHRRRNDQIGYLRIIQLVGTPYGSVVIFRKVDLESLVTKILLNSFSAIHHQILRSLEKRTTTHSTQTGSRMRLLGGQS